MRCPSCNKFPAKDTSQDPEGDLQVDDDGVVTADVTIRNSSECCGDDLEETTFNVEIDLSSDVEDHVKDKHKNGKIPSLSVHGDIVRTDEMATKDRRGRIITKSRYQRRLYGIAVSATVHCDDCNEDIASGDFTDSCPASGMESLV